MPELKAPSLVRGLAGLLAGTCVFTGCDDGATGYAVGGTVAGLAGAGLVLALNGANDLSVPASGPFTFRRKLADGATYEVSVRSHPVGQGCVVANHSGVMGTVAVAGVTVTCSTAAVLTLSSSDPTHGAIGVLRSVTPSFMFSAPLSAATVIPANINLQSVMGDHAVAASAVGSTLGITPAHKLLPLTTYTLTAGTNVRGDQGETLASAATMNFTTRDGAWQIPEPHVVDSTSSGYLPRVGMAGNGNAMLVWMQNNAQGTTSWWSYYTPGDGWSTPQLLPTIKGFHFPAADLVMDEDGNAMAAWLNYEHADCGRMSCTRKGLWVRRFTPEGGWGKATEIAAEKSDDTMELQIVMDAAGNAFVVWSQFKEDRRSIWSRRYVAGAGWGSAKLLETSNGEAWSPRIAMNANGDAVAVWEQQEEDGIYRIRSNRHASSSGWGEAVTIQTDATGDGQIPQVALDASGNALAVWQQHSESQTDTWSNRYIAGAGWGTAEFIDLPPAGYSQNQMLVMDTLGNAVATWSRGYPLGAGEVRREFLSSRYIANAGWSTATMIDASGAALGSPMVVGDARGNLLAVWMHYEGTRPSVWANRHVADSGWGTPTLLETNDTENVYLKGIAIDSSGDATVVWMQGSLSETDIHTVRFE